MFEVVSAVLAFFMILGLTFINGFWLVTLDELELDHLNPADVCKRLNKVVVPEMAVHGILLLACILGWSPWVLLLNLPIAVYHGKKFSANQHFLDPTEILRFKNLKASRNEAIAKTIFFGLQIIYGMYWMVSAIITSAARKTVT
ncbi:hypothetical protein SPRG_09981 [Saprolegnia parasitica CBS 223.65]|uniref:ER-derived vesicles protein ERV14 n=1 Tax=Saprolegnia parasitica (strain CBS 223.65) TaxID=695850 RepID=A0A067BY59_SAPPC|nr:hypothetical protein SPRG_09981 [Saprolegnia parasitica CBS 223.65]KDO23173.1 hypothetical protein SPRG_09981 [Saprolegnia parasitica CBS 223.65]|eukprot:XP_012206125.1 hypothetical protein SPRG_09981 [Saprolegnia parasitica CBS 223.65]